MTTDTFKKLSRGDLRQLKQGDWVAWGKTNWDHPDKKDFAYWEAQLIAHPVRSAQEVMVRFQDLPHAVQKDRLYKVLPVIGVDDMHTQYDYNS